jgi:hypothetical protein
MGFHDSYEGAKLVSLAADKAFYTLKNIWKKDSEKIKKLFREDMEQLSKDGKSGADQESQHDSKDWMRAALKINLYKTWKAIEDNSMDNLVCLLANVIVHCIDNEIDNALIKNCSEWAKEGLEAEIYRAAFITGKLQGVRAQVQINLCRTDRYHSCYCYILSHRCSRFKCLHMARDFCGFRFLCRSANATFKFSGVILAQPQSCG